MFYAFIHHFGALNDSVQCKVISIKGKLRIRNTCPNFWEVMCVLQCESQDMFSISIK